MGLTEERDGCECEEDCDCICMYCRCSNPTDDAVEGILSDTFGSILPHKQCCTE